MNYRILSLAGQGDLETKSAAFVASYIARNACFVETAPDDSCTVIVRPIGDMRNAWHYERQPVAE